MICGLILIYFPFWVLTLALLNYGTVNLWTEWVNGSGVFQLQSIPSKNGSHLELVNILVAFLVILWVFLSCGICDMKTKRDWKKIMNECHCMIKSIIQKSSHSELQLLAQLPPNPMNNFAIWNENMMMVLS